LSIKRSKNLRGKAKKYRAYVCQKYGSKSFYCQEPLIAISSIPEYNRIRIFTPYIFYYDNKKRLCRQRFLTLDHVVRLTHKGSNDKDNLVPACERCNISREPHYRKNYKN